VYVLSDIVTEVYGYALARRVLWYSIAAQLVAVAVFQLVEVYPPSVVMTNNQSYVDVLSAAPRIVLFGTLAVFSGEIINNYVLAKMKVWTGGRYMPARFIVSTLCGQFANTAVFYTCALWGIMPPSLLIKSIALASLIKVGVEIALLPLSIRVSVWLKKSEGTDVFDTATDFNPLKF
jgi:queuosine precursor transporter